MAKTALQPRRKQQPEVQVVVLDLKRPKQGRRRNPHIPPITTHPERLGGTPTIAGTRLPVATLLDYLMEGATIQEFVDDFGVITVADAEAVLEKIKDAMEEGWLAERVDK